MPISATQPTAIINLGNDTHASQSNEQIRLYDDDSIGQVVLNSCGKSMSAHGADMTGIVRKLIPLILSSENLSIESGKNLIKNSFDHIEKFVDIQPDHIKYETLELVVRLYQHLGVTGKTLSSSAMETKTSAFSRELNTLLQKY